MWQYRIEIIDPGTAEKFVLVKNDTSISYGEAIDLLYRDESFRRYLTTLLANVVSFSAFRWEAPSATLNSLNRNFEFVVLNCPMLSRAADATAFAEHFRDEDVVTFASLRGDATMIVPCPRVEHLAYVHLASFLRKAPAVQIDRLWQAVAGTMLERLSEKPCWLSTAGMGVAWLHVRIDSRPKYYGHTPYRT